MSEHNQEQSWAAVVAKDADQSPEEARARPVNRVIPTESTNTTSLIDVDTGSVNVVPSDFLEQPVKTETQAHRMELEEEAKAQSEANSKAKKKHPGKGRRGERRVGVTGTGELPLELINAVLGGVAALVVGVAAWRKYRVGELSWKVVGIWGSVAAAVAAADVIGLRFFKQQQTKLK